LGTTLEAHHEGAPSIKKKVEENRARAIQRREEKGALPKRPRAVSGKGKKAVLAVSFWVFAKAL